MPSLLRQTYYYLSLLVCAAGFNLAIAYSSWANDLAVVGIAPHQIATKKPLVVNIPPLEANPEYHHFYFRKLLNLALEKTVATDGPFVIHHHPQRLSTSRFMQELKNDGLINIIWATIDSEREENFLPIKISLLRELNDYRVLLIRKGDQAKFDKLNSEQELKALAAGSGSNWPVTQVLRNHGYKVVSAADYNALFKMLSAKRFDYYPRGLHQAWNEQKTHRNKNLVIEKRFMLHIPAPFYFFVNKNNVALADRIARGLTSAQADGSFAELFYSTPGFKFGEDIQYHPNRIMFELVPHY
jgi:hypothetical protein